MQKQAIIVGAGPAGLTAAYELLTRTDIIPIVLEKSGEIGGISRTTNYKGNRMDMGPHRFFSKSDRVMDWWLKMMPLDEVADKDAAIHYQNKSRPLPTASQQSAGGKDPDKTMLVIRRLTRIYFLRKFFAYPIQLSLDTLRTLGLIRTIRILISFVWIRLFPRTPEISLEDFIINKFGRQLYLLFFKDYTEKVWGIAPSQISAEWGAQRIKGVSLSKALAGAVKSLRGRRGAGKGIAQKDTETSLIEQFLYPKYGPGSLWEEVAHNVQELGGKLYLNQDVQNIFIKEGQVRSVKTVDALTGESAVWEGDYFISTMPVQELIAAMGEAVPVKVQTIAAGLQYRDFINVGVLLRQMSDKTGKRLELKDNWVYIQERDVKVGRLMIYNNWGGGMIKDPDTTWIGMEYFCNKTDAFWGESDENIQHFAIQELEQMDLARPEDVLDSTVKRMEKTYPAYFGTYSEFDQVRSYTDEFENLFLVGRNGMHKYNNADHSMLTAMVAVDNIAAGVTSKANIWAINTEQEYHEEKSMAGGRPAVDGNGAISGRSKAPFLVDYLWKNKPNRAWWLAGLALFLVQLVIFKFRYPFANYMPDSYSYLEAASSNADVNMWPVAYSKFLRFFSVFTHSDKIVVGFQYLFLQCSVLLYLFSLLYWLKPRRGVRTILFLFFLLDPLPLYVANYISADALFIGLSLLWLTTLVWIIYKPQGWLLLVNGLLLLACFTVRYNAIYYPFIGILAFFLSRQSWRRKIAGIGLGVGLVMASFLFTSYKMKEVTGKWQFSAFGGWQLANNALYMYQHIPAAQRGPVPKEFIQLEMTVRAHMDTLRKVKFSHDDSSNSFFYLWSGRGPLIQYLKNQYKKDSISPYFNRWASEGPLYEQYATYLIKRHPLEFAQEWLWPNALKFAVPPTEFLGAYNMGGDSVRKLAKDWFNYKTQKVQEHKGKKDHIAATEWFPVFASTVNILFLMGLIGVISLGALQWKEYGLPQLLGVMVVFWLVNCSFSIFASPIVLRYQVFPLFAAFAVGAILIERIYQLARTE
jgi:protoporphyrinogen oxidase/4-amino-4-deoxy-L-arabinose transferase-like glycosyltransferase